MSKTLQVRIDQDLLDKIQWIKTEQQERNKRTTGIDIKFSDSDILRWAITQLYDQLQKQAAE